MPTPMTIGVMNFSGVTDMMARIAALMKPDDSATPIPSIATRTVPTGPKVTKMLTISVMYSTNTAPDS